MKMNLIGIILLFAITGCKKEVETQIATKISSIELTGCTNSQKSTKSNNSCITIKSLEDKNLIVTHVGTEFCCESKQVEIDFKIIGDTIEIREIDKGPFSYCFCEHNLSFQIGPLDYGDYKIKIIESENSYNRDTLVFEFNHSSITNFTNCN